MRTFTIAWLIGTVVATAGYLYLIGLAWAESRRTKRALRADEQKTALADFEKNRPLEDTPPETDREPMPIPLIRPALGGRAEPRRDDQTPPGTVHKPDTTKKGEP